MNNFPFFHLLALVLGAIILFIVKRKYKKIRTMELITIFILYFILVALFTEAALNSVRNLIRLIQID